VTLVSVLTVVSALTAMTTFLPAHISGCHRLRLGQTETRHPLNRRVKPGNQMRGDWPGPCHNGSNMAGVFENALLRRFRATVTDNMK
jgi:hypothetical protein